MKIYMNMILLGEYIFIFSSPACNKCIIFYIKNKLNMAFIDNCRSTRLL